MDIGIKRKSPHEPSVHAGSSMVGVTGLEPMASWSRTNQGIIQIIADNLRLALLFFEFRTVLTHRILLGCQSGCQSLPRIYRVFACCYCLKR